MTGSMWGLLRQTAMVVVCGFAMSACSSLTNITGMGSPLHNEADFQTATTAKTTSDAIDYLKPITEERANQARLLDHELTVVRDFAVARRNAELMALLNDSEGPALSDGILDNARRRLVVLVGTTSPNLKPAPSLTEVTVQQLRTAAGNATCGTEPVTVPSIEENTNEAKRLASAETMAEFLQVLSANAEQCESELQTKQRTFERVAGFPGPACPWDGMIKPLDDSGHEQARAKYKKAHPTTTRSNDDIRKLIGPVHEALVKTCLQSRTNQRAFETLVLGCAKEECFKGAGPEVAVNGFAGESLVSETMSKLREARSDRDAASKAAKEAQAVLASAVKAYEEAAAANLDAPGTETQKAVDKATEEVRKAVKTLTETGAALGLEMSASEQIAKIDLLLQAAGGGEIDDETVKNNPDLAGALAIANALPSFVDRIKFIEGEVNAPPLSSLILEKARLQAIAADAKRSVERQSQTIALMEAKIEAINLEVDMLMGSLIDVRDATKTSGAITTSQLVQHSGAEKDREGLVFALEQYLSSFTGPRQTFHALTYREIALVREAALDKSETSLQIWKATIQTPVDALVAYHGSGLKPEDLIELLKAIGIGVIGAGVI